MSSDVPGWKDEMLHDHFSKLPPEIREPLVMSVDEGWTLTPPSLCDVKDCGVGLKVKMDDCCFGTL